MFARKLATSDRSAATSRSYATEEDEAGSGFRCFARAATLAARLVRAVTAVPMETGSGIVQDDSGNTKDILEENSRAIFLT